MIYSPRFWQRYRTLIVRALAAPVLLSLAGARSEAAPPSEPLPAPAVVAPAPALDLAGLRALALEQQPALAAYRASLEAAQLKQKALDDLKLVSIIRRDLPTRRKQACQGVIAASAQLAKAEWDTVFSVTRTYLTLVYVRQQRKIADQLLSTDEREIFSLATLREVADKFRMEDRKDIRPWNIGEIDVLIKQTTARREEAIQGEQRALAALREAVGLADSSLTPALPDELPKILPPVNKEQIVALALSRRGEIAKAAAGLEVTALEIQAQKSSFSLNAQTFGIGSDVHADQVPMGNLDGDYRPGAVGLEMPATLSGHRSARVAQARALHDRATAVVEKARQLVALEAEDAFYRWQEASNRYRYYSEAAEQARKVAGEVILDPKRDRPSLDEVMRIRVKATQLRLKANEALYDTLVALAALERVTAGGFCPGLESPGKPAK